MIDVWGEVFSFSGLERRRQTRSDRQGATDKELVHKTDFRANPYTASHRAVGEDDANDHEKFQHQRHMA